MKIPGKNIILLAAGMFIVSSAFSQQQISNVEFEGEKTEVLKSTSTSYGKGTLASGEAITTECMKGTCYVIIDYKGRKIQTPVGESITSLTVFEYDFGADEDKELVVVNDSKGTSYMFVYAYARGIIQKLYQKEIFNNRTVVKTNYIEMYSPGGLDTVWNYYQGMFWTMKQAEF